MELKITDKIVAGRAVLVGVDSFGMILAASAGDKLYVNFLDDEIPAGSEIR